MKFSEWLVINSEYITEIQINEHIKATLEKDISFAEWIENNPDMVTDEQKRAFNDYKLHDETLKERNLPKNDQPIKVERKTKRVSMDLIKRIAAALLALGVALTFIINVFILPMIEVKNNEVYLDSFSPEVVQVLKDYEDRGISEEYTINRDDAVKKFVGTYRELGLSEQSILYYAREAFNNDVYNDVLKEMGYSSEQEFMGENGYVSYTGSDQGVKVYEQPDIFGGYFDFDMDSRENFNDEVDNIRISRGI